MMNVPIVLTMTPIFNRPWRPVLAAAALLATMSTVALAQSGGGPPTNVKMRIGPIYINPTMALSNAGVDDNVFNTAGNRTSDYTITVTPKTDLWVRFGPSWLTVNIREDITYFQKSASERSANSGYTLSWNIPLSRLTFTPNGTYLNTRDRPGFEIDTRAKRAEISYGVQTDLRVLSKTSLGFTVDQHRTLFDASATYLDVNLKDELNRVGTTMGVNVSHQLTPLTTVSVNVSQEQDRFTYQTLRNSDTTMISTSIKFDPAALIKGGATIGFESYKPADPSTPGYTGSTATVNLSYVFLGITKVGATVGRHVQNSYDINQPYYVETGATLEVGQQLFGPLDIVGRGGLQQLAYQNRVGAVVVEADRVDHVKSFGGGLGYHLGKDTRIGFNIDQDHRESVILLHQYTGLKYGFSVTYGGG